MAETTMPAAEAMPAVAHSDERNSYELAFHVLPTVADGEVSGVFEALKTLIEKDGGEVFAEEAPERVDLAYEIVQHIEGKNRAFNSAYFGWVRFKLAGDAISAFSEEVEHRSDILRYLIIKLTKVEEEQPFFYHESRKTKKVVTVNEDDPVTEAKQEEKAEVKVEPKTEHEEPAEVKEEELAESLDKITSDEEETKN